MSQSMIRCILILMLGSFGKIALAAVFIKYHQATLIEVILSANEGASLVKGVKVRLIYGGRSIRGLVIEKKNYNLLVKIEELEGVTFLKNSQLKIEVQETPPALAETSKESFRFRSPLKKNMGLFSPFLYAPTHIQFADPGQIALKASFVKERHHKNIGSSDSYRTQSGMVWHYASFLRDEKLPLDIALGLTEEKHQGEARLIGDKGDVNLGKRAASLKINYSKGENYSFGLHLLMNRNRFQGSAFTKNVHLFVWKEWHLSFFYKSSNWYWGVGFIPAVNLLSQMNQEKIFLQKGDRFLFYALYPVSQKLSLYCSNIYHLNTRKLGHETNPVKNSWEIAGGFSINHARAKVELELNFKGEKYHHLELNTAAENIAQKALNLHVTQEFSQIFHLGAILHWQTGTAKEKGQKISLNKASASIFFATVSNPGKLVLQ